MHKPVRFIGVVLLAACTGATASRDEMRRDTLFAGPVVPATTASAPAIDSIRSSSVEPDTGIALHAFIGFTAKSGRSTLPELAIVAADGRRTGFDPVTRRNLAELPGAYYESEPVLDDDDAPSGPPDSAPSKPVIDVRTLDAPAHAGASYTFMVAADGGGSFVLHIDLTVKDADGSRPAKPLVWEDTDFAIGRGQVRRVNVRVADGTLEVHPDTTILEPDS